MVIDRAQNLTFYAEKDLEKYLRIHLSVLVSALGQDLLVIGEQVQTAFGGRIDLLAIDATGAIHIIELKIGGTSPEIVGQVTDYLYWIRQLTAEEIIGVAARSPLCVHLEVAFQEQFGYPLPAAVNQAQALTIIAAAIDLRTQRSMLAIRRSGPLTRMFRYVVEPDAIRLIPCCREVQDVEATHTEPRPPALREGPPARVPGLAPRYRVHIDENIRRFWQSHAHQATSPILLFRVIYEEYTDWVRAHAAEGVDLPLRTVGQFGRQLAAITAESDEWARVLVAPGSNLVKLGRTSAPSTRTRPDANHRTVAYLKKTGRPGT